MMFDLATDSGPMKVDAVEAGCGDTRVITTVCVRTKRGMFYGVSNCEPNDEYDRVGGYERAMARALDQFLPNLPLVEGGMCANLKRYHRKHERRMIWQALLGQLGGC
jgi:hypothetical protein